MMNEQVKTKWVDALLSGEYTQGKNLLRDSENNFCCLGVLCDLYSKETGAEWNTDAERAVYSIKGSAATLPKEVQDWAGLEYRNPMIRHGMPNGEVIGLGLGSILIGSEFENIATLNDSGKFPFAKIAEFIKEQL